MTDDPADTSTTLPDPDTFRRLANRIARIVPSRAEGVHNVLGQLEAVDVAVYEAVARTPTPTLDLRLQQLSDLANFSKLWVGVAGVLAVAGGSRGRRAAVEGLASVALASLIANQVVKPIAVRGRPDREGGAVPDARHVRMPTSRSFPSGHTASAFAFATGVSGQIPALSLPVGALAAAVGYSRVHTGVHFPGDVMMGSLIGAASGEVVGGVLRVSRQALQRRRGLRVAASRTS